jgi:5-methylcytosine-specific restriction endonuclease McrA
MEQPPPTVLPAADPRTRAFPASWVDAAIVMLRAEYSGMVPCALCQKLAVTRAELRALHADHVIPFARGGLTVWTNMQLLCAPCNYKKSAKSPAV